jgi:hypothetical protein
MDIKLSGMAYETFALPRENGYGITEAYFVMHSTSGDGWHVLPSLRRGEFLRSGFVDLGLDPGHWGDHGGHWEADEFPSSTATARQDVKRTAPKTMAVRRLAIVRVERSWSHDPRSPKRAGGRQSWMYSIEIAGDSSVPPQEQ